MTGKENKISDNNSQQQRQWYGNISRQNYFTKLCIKTSNNYSVAWFRHANLINNINQIWVYRDKSS